MTMRICFPANLIWRHKKDIAAHTSKLWGGVRHFEIECFPFWAVVVDKKLDKRVGTLRLGLDEPCPDLALWIYPQYRNKGYGTASFALALRYIFSNYPYSEIAADCFEDNL